MIGSEAKMHSHDRTQIAQYGFADPDKRNPRHDLACQYASKTEVSRRILASVFSGVIEKGTQYDIKNEFPLTKGKDIYEVVVGFIDVMYVVDRLGFVALEIKCSGTVDLSAVSRVIEGRGGPIVRQVDQQDLAGDRRFGRVGVVSCEHSRIYHCLLEY